MDDVIKLVEAGYCVATTSNKYYSLKNIGNLPLNLHHMIVLKCCLMLFFSVDEGNVDKNGK